jgi:hypothetical protein
VALAVALLAAGCGAAAPAVRPAEARSTVLATPEIAAWWTAHSAPGVLAGMGPADARRWRRYHPAMTFDLGKHSYLVTLEAKFGPEPRRMTLPVDRETGRVLPPEQ